MKAKERELLRWFRQLDAERQDGLLSYAEFLSEKLQQARHNPDQHQTPLPEPLQIAAKESESVVGAIKRLSKSYYMLESTDLLNRASTLMSQHVMQGRPAVEIIGELEEMFSQNYKAYRDTHSKNKKGKE